MTKVELGEHMPVGFCGECLARMAQGAHYQAAHLDNGRTLVHAYCEHRQAGGLIVLRAGRPVRWTITIPIDVLEWERLMQLRRVAFSAMPDQAAPPPAFPAVQTSGHAKETLQ